MIAHAVTGTKVLVGWIIKHTPAKASGMFTALVSGIQHPAVAKGMLLLLFPGIKSFGGKHVTVVFGDQQSFIFIRRYLFLRLCSRSNSVMREVIVGVHILQQMTVFDITHTGSCTAGIQTMGQRICMFVKSVVILTFIDAHTPENDGGMIAILQDHFACVSHRLFFPGRITDMLPSRDLRKDQHAPTVTFIKKMLTLRIMTGTYCVAAQFFLEDTHIFPL